MFPMLQVALGSVFIHRDLSFDLLLFSLDKSKNVCIFRRNLNSKSKVSSSIPWIKIYKTREGIPVLSAEDMSSALVPSYSRCSMNVH